MFATPAGNPNPTLRRAFVSTSTGATLRPNPPMRRLFPCWFTRGVGAVAIGLLFSALAFAAPQLVPGVYGYGADRAVNPAGFASNATIYEVTSLSDANVAGTLRHAVNQTGPRIVVFRVSGVIDLLDDLEVDQPNLTIAGQTAPAPGIALHGASLNVNASYVLVQHLRIRPGDRWNGVPSYNRDAVAITNSSTPPTNVVFDQCTFAWSSDEMVSTWYNWNNITFNRCIFAEPLHHSIHLDEGTFTGGNVEKDAQGLTFSKSSSFATITASSTAALGGSFHQIDTTADGQWIEYELNLDVESSDRFAKHLTLTHVTGPNRARFKADVWDMASDGNGGFVKNRHLLNSTSTGEIVDQYASTATLQTYVSQQNTTSSFRIYAGVEKLRVRLTVAGRNASSTGWSLGIDRLSITDSHGFGPLFSSGGAAGGRLSFTNSIIAHLDQRGPWSAAREFFFANNVMYNRITRFMHLGHSSFADTMKVAVVGNTYIEGPNMSTSSTIASPISNSSTRTGSQLYIPTADNVYDPGDRASPPAMIASGLSSFLVGTDPTTKTAGLADFEVLTPAAAFDETVLRAGARPSNRDWHEQRIVQNVLDGAATAQLTTRPGAIQHSVAGAGGWPTYASNTATWTLPTNPHADDTAAGYPAGNGYSNIEEWLHRMAAVLETDPAATYSDTFSDGNASGWTTDGGTWTVTGGAYAQTNVNASANRAVLGATHWSDQSIEADARYTAQSGADRFFGVVVRYTGPDDYYYFILRTGGTVELKKLAGGVVTGLASASRPVAVNTTYRLRLTAEGGELRAYVDGTLVLQATDLQHAVGRTGLLSYLTVAEFDNVVASSTVTVPAPGAFALTSPVNGATGVATTPTLDWGDATNATSYTLTVDNNSDFSSPVLLQSGITSSQHTLGAALTQATQYHWRVSAVNGGGSTDATNNPFSFTTTLPAPSGLGATAASISQINLSWTDNSANEDGFRIERKKGVAGTYAQIATVGAGVTTYSDTNLGAGTAYYYRVRAYRGTVESSYASEANATTTEVTSGRQAHWKLDENTGTSAADASGNSNTGTLANGANWVAGKIGTAVNFDAVDNVINAGSGASLDNLAALTIAAWIKINTIGEGASPGRILHKGTGTSAVAGWQFVTQNTHTIGFAVDHATTDLNRVAANNVLTPGQWHHVAVTWTGSATATNVKLYIDGVETGTYASTTNGSGTRTSDASSSVFIGNNSTGERTFDGAIDDVRVYNRVITAAELQAIHRAGL